MNMKLVAFAAVALTLAGTASAKNFEHHHKHEHQGRHQAEHRDHRDARDHHEEFGNNGERR